VTRQRKSAFSYAEKENWSPSPLDPLDARASLQPTTTRSVAPPKEVTVLKEM
jgi:hypothetical protein